MIEPARHRGACLMVGLATLFAPAAGRAEEPQAIAAYVVVRNAGGCSHEELGPLFRGPGRGAKSAFLQAKVACDRVKGDGRCRIEMRPSTPQASHFVIARSVLKCRDGTSAVHFGVGSGATSEEAWTAAQSDLSDDFARFDPSLDTYERVHTEMAGVEQKMDPMTAEVVCRGKGDEKSRVAQVGLVSRPESGFHGLVVVTKTERRVVTLQTLLEATGQVKKRRTDSARHPFLSLKTGGGEERGEIDAEAIVEVVCPGTTLEAQGPGWFAKFGRLLGELAKEDYRRACPKPEADPRRCQPTTRVDVGVKD